MSDEERPDDVEGQMPWHTRKPSIEAADSTEGEARHLATTEEEAEDDTQAHGWRGGFGVTEDDDVEGHAGKKR